MITNHTTVDLSVDEVSDGEAHGRGGVQRRPVAHLQDGSDGGGRPPVGGRRRSGVDQPRNRIVTQQHRQRPIGQGDSTA